MAAPGDLGFAHRNERAKHFHFRVCAEPNRVAHCAHEVFAAIRIDGVITRMRGNHESLRFVALSKSASDGKHDAVSEGDDRLLHRLLLIVAIWNGTPGLEEVGLE